MEEKTIWEINFTSIGKRILAGLFIGAILFPILYILYYHVLILGEWVILVLIALLTPNFLMVFFMIRMLLLPGFHIKFSENQLYFRKILFKKVFLLSKIKKIEINLVKRREYKRGREGRWSSLYWINELKFTLEINPVFKKSKVYSFKARFEASKEIYGHSSATREKSNDMLFQFINNLNELSNIFPNLVIIRDSTSDIDY